ncbi:MAG: tetratricopeptide repeat protein [Gloeomargarita sp. GMQP_bins_120]
MTEKQALRINPNFAYIHGTALNPSRQDAVGNAYDWQRAMTNYNQALRLDPNFALAYCQRGAVGDIRRALLLDLTLEIPAFMLPQGES